MARKKKKKNNNIHISAINKPTLVIIVAVSMVAGIVSGVACAYSLIFLPAVIIFFWLAYACMAEWARRK